MRDWTFEEQTALSEVDSLLLGAGPKPRREVELGIALVHDALYVRAFRGPESRWFRAALASGVGRITAGTMTREVVLIPETGPVHAIEAAYRTRYGSAIALIATPQARAATLRIMPA